MKQIYKERLAKLAHAEIAKSVKCGFYTSPGELCDVAEVMDGIKSFKPRSHRQITTKLTEDEIADTVFSVLDLAKIADTVFSVLDLAKIADTVFSVLDLAKIIYF